VLSRFLGGGLRSGDPAALLDARTGTLSWMAVNPVEEMQIGHYEQMKHRYTEAWRRYEHAIAAQPDAGSTETPAAKSATEWLGQLFSPRGIAVFQFHCLSKLGRLDEARKSLDAFRKSYPPQLPSLAAQSAEASIPGTLFPLDQPWFRDAMQPGGLCTRLLQDLYIAEVLLSLDSADDASDYFRRASASSSGETDITRLSAAVVLSQILLLKGKYDDYAELSTETLAPLLLKLRRSQPAQTNAGALDLTRHVPDVVGGLALLPLSCKTFLAGLSKGVLTSMAVRWEALGSNATDDLDRLAIDLVLEASYRQLDRPAERRRVLDRIERNPVHKSAAASAGTTLAGTVTDEMVESVRALASGTALGFQTPDPSAR
jgi:hypothetical protein